MSSIKPATIAPGSWVLVTGVNGFIGSHITNELLIKGYRVRGTARDSDKGAWIESLFEERYGKDRYESVIVSDVAAEGAFDEALKGEFLGPPLDTCINAHTAPLNEGVEGVVHVASDLSLNPSPNEVVPQTIARTLNLLTSAAREPSVRSFVLTSSSMAACTPTPNKVFTVTTDSWNQDTIKEAWAPPPYEKSRALFVYGASKTESEMEAWKFVKEKKPAFIFNTVLPSTTFGPVLDFANQSASSAGLLRMLFQGNPAIEIINPQYFNDIRDCANLHIAALTIPEVKNERLFSWQKRGTKTSCF